MVLLNINKLNKKIMNAKELRIGNLVEYRITDIFDDRKEWWEVSEIDADDIHWLSKVDAKDEDFRPITITEEWLLNFGFDKQENDFYASKLNNLFKILIVENDYPLHIEWMNIPLRNYGKIQFVHQLQNLYFYLCGKELVCYK